ncbi:hypothetical protein B0I37DRAFT_38726 [Chaetomium sp. MPI-CAGE-AT-0009]|nr:hypothetical protein B0I37DRAFT_38726 [Chaetomium sp. MPI-CAGE-AT-0009]
MNGIMFVLGFACHRCVCCLRLRVPPDLSSSRVSAVPFLLGRLFCKWLGFILLFVPVILSFLFPFLFYSFFSSFVFFFFFFFFVMAVFLFLQSPRSFHISL